MTTTLIRYILYLTLISSVVSAEKVNISFEVFHANNSYLDIAKQKLNKLQKKGLSCYIVKDKDDVSVRCNDSHTLQEMQENINRLQNLGIEFVIISSEYKEKHSEYKKPNKLLEGYQAYNKKEYRKAYSIFSKLYESEDNYENAYAYALALMKLHKYERALDVLYKYKQPKARLLYKNIAHTYFYHKLKKKKYREAYNIAKSYHLGKKTELEIPYMQAVNLFEKKEYNSALELLSSYRNKSSKIEKLYNDILYAKFIDRAWSFIDTNPAKALQIFKNACKIKKEFDCYNGMMYAYYNLKKYDVSLYLAEKLYIYKADPKLAEMAFNSSLALKNYREAKIWYLILEDHEDSRDLLKKKMDLDIAQKDYKSAKKLAERVLEDNPNDSDAKYILALDAFENKNYKECLSLVRDISFTQDYQKDIRYRCQAYDALANGNVERAETTIKKVKNDETLYAFYLDLAKYFEEKDDARALVTYAKAKELSKQIDGELAYLYALKNFHKEQKLEDELAYAYKTFPQEKKQLDKFKIMYDKERLFQLYQAKEYEECYAFSKTIETEQKDKDIYTLTGWCAYSSGNYAAAKEAFAQAGKMAKSKNEELYAYALSSAQLHERDDAIKALDQINFSNEKEKQQAIGLYADLQDQERAKSLLKTVKNESDRERALQSINKSYTKLLYENSVSAGLYWQAQAGTSGMTTFDKYVIPIDYDYYDASKDMHFYIDADIMYLYNGKLNDVGAYDNYGFATYTQANTLEDDSGLMPKVGLDYKNYHFMIGTTPLGSKISPELTALLSTYFVKNRWLATFKIEQKELDETMLSFVGERAQDGIQEVYWGRVLKRGATVGISYDAAVSLALNLTYFPEIFGKNVQTNSQKKAVVTAIYYPAVDKLDYLQVGAIGIYDSYDKNENLFTYGHGGYFSPQSFFMAGIFTEFGDHLKQDLYYKAKLGVGFETYSVDDAQKFPLHDGVVNSNVIVKGYEENGIDYKLALQLGYKINSNFDLISGISFENFQNYRISEFTFAFVYRFDEHFNDFNTFYLNHRVDHIIPRYEVAK